MATATASINSCSVSHWYSVTTPLCRKGTIAKPLPNTNAPALVKNHAIFPKVPALKFQKPIPNSNTEFVADGLLIHFGGDFKNIYKRPAVINNKTSSRSVITVTTAPIIKNNQSSQCCAKALLLNLLIDFSVSL